MERKVQILSIKKNEIIIRKKKNQNNIFVMSAIIVALLLICFFVGNDIGGMKQVFLQAYNPVSSLYNDNSKIIFTSGGVLEKDSVTLTLPVKGAKYTICEDGTIEFLIGNYIIVSACDSGIVEGVGITLDGVKYIKINHSNGIVTVIENIEIVGVNVGDVVKSGQDIATTKANDIIRLNVFSNGSKVNTPKIIKSKILWEN